MGSKGKSSEKSAPKEQKGFLGIARIFFNNPLWTEERTFSKAEAWLDLIQMARWQTQPEKRFIKGISVTIQRGQLIGSRRYLGDKWGWDKNKVTRFIKYLENEKMIRCSETQAGTGIELINYDRYNKTAQEMGQEAGQHENYLNEPQERVSGLFEKINGTPLGTESGTLAGHQRDTDRDKLNNINKGNKEEEEKKPAGFSSAASLELYKMIDKSDTGSIIDFITEHKPQEIKPYWDLWNLFSDQYKYKKVKRITQERIEAFRARLQEPEFDFIEILTKVSKSTWIPKAKWFDFDWIIEKQKNYLGILEGKYDEDFKENQVNPGSNNGSATKRIQQCEELATQIILGARDDLFIKYPGKRPHEIAQMEYP